MGSHEGEIIIPPLTGPRLFSTPNPVLLPRHHGPAIPLRADRRAAYDDITLSRAIHDGIDSAGHRLNKLMPRYRLDEPDLGNLLAYLRQLGQQPEPGVELGRLRLATIITPDAPTTRRDAVIDTLQHWAVRDGLTHLTIDLDVWLLRGPADGWPKQLETYYKERPPFAVLAGAGASNWKPVAEFCELQQLPCVFPIIDAAPDENGRHYSVYLDPGLPLEARLAARYLQTQPPTSGRIVQFITDEATQEAAAQLAASTPGAETRRWVPGSTTGSEGISDQDIVVAWLKPPELERLLAQLAKVSPQTLLSARLAPPDEIRAPDTLKPRLRWISARVEPARLRAHRSTWVQPWLDRIGINDASEPTYSEAYAAVQFFADALARMRGNWYREYLLEMLEGGMYGRAAGQAYFSLSLAPGQRWAAKGGRVLGLQPPGYRVVVPVSERLVP